jgi:hypothetical protein
MSLLLILKIIAAVGTLATGALGIVRPAMLTGFTGLSPAGGRGLTEMRVSLGAVFAGLGLAALLLNAPDAYRVLGLMYLAMAVVRAPAILIDKSAEASNLISLAVEVVFGVILVV